MRISLPGLLVVLIAVFPGRTVEAQEQAARWPSWSAWPAESSAPGQRTITLPDSARVVSGYQHWRGAGLGAAIVGSVSAVVMAVLASGSRCSDCVHELTSAKGALYGGLIGGGVGGVLGFLAGLASPKYIWVPASETPRFAAQAQGVGSQPRIPMYLYKAAGATYRRVVRLELHAFPYSPVEVSEDEFILLSKNREDCDMLEKQVQYAGKLHSVRPATKAELDEFFPGVAAGGRWRYAMQLYWVRRFQRRFNLFEVPGFNAPRYATVQGFAKLDPEDELVMLRHLIATNADLILDVINNSERPESEDTTR